MIYSAPAGSKIALSARGAIVAHPDRPPLFVTWDEAGTITEQMIDAVLGRVPVDAAKSPAKPRSA